MKLVVKLFFIFTYLINNKINRIYLINNKEKDDKLLS